MPRTLTDWQRCEMDISAWLANMGGGDSGVAAGASKEQASEDAAGSHFPHISAANALAAAVSSGEAGAKNPRSKQHGKPLKPDSVLDLDEPRSSTQPQLQVQPITVIKTEYRLQMMHLITVNSTYISYGLKQGSIRILNKSTAARVLLKDHGSMITDMQFFSSGSNLLASCDQDGDVVIRKIFEDGEGEGEDAPPILHELLARHALGPSPAATRRLAWHPQLDSLLAVVSNDRVALVNVPPTSGVAASPEFASPALPTNGAMTEGSITTLAFFDQGNMLAVADNCGFVYIWALDADMVERWAAGGMPLEPLPTEPDVKFRAFDDGQFVAAMDFLPSRQQEQGQEQQASLLVGDSTCRVLKLWSIDVEAKPQRSSMLELVSSQKGPTYFFNHMLLQPNFNAVVLANCRSREVYVVHIHQSSSGAATFDHFTDFAVTYPILSMSTTTEPCFEDGAEVFQLYTVQTEGIQQYTLFPETCLPGIEDDEAEQQGEADEPRGTAPAVPVPHGTPSRQLSAAAEAPSVHLLSPADVLNSGWGSGTLELTKSVPDSQAQPEAVDAGRAAVDAGSARAASSLPRPQQPGAGASAAPAAAAGSATSGGSGSTPHVRTHDASPVAPAAAAAAADSAGEAAAPSAPVLQKQEHPMPPQPTLLVKKLSAAAWAPSAGPATPVEARSVAESMEAASGSKQGSIAARAASAAGDEEPTSAAAMALPAGVAVAAAAAGGGESELARVISLQQQLLSQLAFTQRETVKQLRAEMTKNAKAAEAATAKAVEAAWKAYAKQAEQERAKEAKREREETAKALQAACAGVVKDVASRIQDASRATVTALTNTLGGAISAAVAEALPAALSSGATEQALEQALSSQLRTALPRAMADNFAANVIPAFERATQAMFGQIDAAFSAGLAEHLSASRDSLAPVGAELKEAAAQVKGAVQQLGAASAALSAAAAAGAGGAGAGAPGGPGAALVDRNRSGAISLAELEAQRDPKILISSQLAKRNYQAAFMHALSTGNAETTMWLCKQITPAAVFDIEPCPLSQDVLLSLVTHLAYQLQTTDTDVKLAWLVEITPAIDPKHPKVVEHCKQVLEPIKAQLAILARSLTGDTGKLAKTAVHLVNSLLHQ